MNNLNLLPRQSWWIGKIEKQSDCFACCKKCVAVTGKESETFDRTTEKIVHFAREMRAAVDPKFISIAYWPAATGTGRRCVQFRFRLSMAKTEKLKIVIKRKGFAGGSMGRAYGRQTLLSDEDKPGGKVPLSMVWGRFTIRGMESGTQCIPNESTIGGRKSPSIYSGE